MSALPSLPNTPIPVVPPPQASSAVSEQAGPAVSFEAVLQAQLGIVPDSTEAFLPEAAKGVAPAPDLEPVEDNAPAAAPADAAPQLLFLPAGLPGFQPATPEVQPSVTDATPVLRNDRQPAARTLPPALATDAEAPPADPGAVSPQALIVNPAQPANFAAELQRLPAAAPVADSQPAAGAPAALPAAPAPNADRRVDAPQPQPQHVATAIPGTVGEQRWGDALSQRVVWMVGQQVRAAEFRVEPPQLGPIEVRLSITNDQANLTFSAPHSVARDAIQTALPRLQEMLQETGLTLGNVFVGAQTQQDQRESAAGGERAAATGAIPGVSEAGASGIDATEPVRRLRGLVDLYA